MQDRERVLSALSHDMKNLVGAVDMNLQLIPLVLQSQEPAPVGEFIERAHQAALGIGSLVDDVVSWFRMADGGKDIRETDSESEMQLGRMAALVRAEFSSAIKTQGLIFHLEMHGESASPVAGQGAPWRVLRLVLQHCLRFLFPNQTLNVKLSVLDGGAFEVSVSTNQDAMFDGQARSLALLLALDFASSSGGVVQAQTTESVTFRWV